MFGFLEARFPGSDGKQDPEKIKAFATANPETTRQGAWLASKPVPGSYVGVSYWGIHGYTLTSAQGKAQVVKFKLVPTGGEAGLTDDEAKAKPADFLVAELTDRLAKKAPAGFDVIALLGEAGDPTNDPTVMWRDEDSRKTVKLGTIAITTIEKTRSATPDSSIRRIWRKELRVQRTIRCSCRVNRLTRSRPRVGRTKPD